MTTTKRVQAGSPKESKAPSGPALGAPELMTRIACKGRSAAPVLEEVQRALADSAARDRDPLVVLEDLGLLRDSVATLIKGLSRLLVGYPRTVTFWESSGYTEAFLSVMEKKV